MDLRHHEIEGRYGERTHLWNNTGAATVRAIKKSLNRSDTVCSMLGDINIDKNATVVFDETEEDTTPLNIAPDKRRVVTEKKDVPVETLHSWAQVKAKKNRS